MRRRRAYKESDNNKNHQEGGSENQNEQQQTRNTWAVNTFENKLLETFYKDNIIPSEEWDKFMAALRMPLNTSVRICPTVFGEQNEPTTQQKHFVNTLLSQLQDAFTAEKVRLLNFIPSAIDFTLTRGALRKNNNNTNSNEDDAAAPPAQNLNRHAKAALNALSDHGFLSRQEVVSMVPPVLLDVQPGHRVLDMCAAPGSKTMQMLEKLVTPTEGPSSKRGFVIANDVNAGRLDVLQKQTGRNQFAASHLVVTNFDARLFPTPLMKNPEFKSEEPASSTNLPFAAARFDRILCDAMCSGDGTLRKSADLWERWKPNNSLSLHNSQKNVLFRGMQLCKQDGIIVYSTCSMHPVEDEAVVAAAIKMANEAGGKFELMNPKERLPNLQFYPGQRNWKIMAPDNTFVDEDDFLKNHKNNNEQQEQEKEKEKEQDTTNINTKKNNNNKYPPILIPSMFPSFAAQDAALVPNIEYCCRVVPHHQDTGGFFIAAMKCVQEIPSSTSHQKQIMISKQQQQQEKNGNNNNNKNNNNNGNRRNEKDADIFVPISEEIKNEIQSVLHLPANFPFDRLYARKVLAREPKIYYISEDAKNAIEEIGNSGTGKNAPRIVSVGVRVIDSISRFSFRASRLSIEGANVMAQHMPSEFIFNTDAASVLKELEENGTKNNNNNNTTDAAATTTTTTNASNAFATTVRFKLPNGWRPAANEIVRQQHEARMEKIKNNNKDSSTSISTSEDSATATAATIASSYPQPLRQILVTIRLGPNVPNTNKMSVSSLTIPAELDSTNFITLRLQRTTLNLLRYSLEGGFKNVQFEEKEEDEDRKQRRLNGGGGGKQKNDDDDDSEDEDEKCCEGGPKVPPVSS